jgi:hypothetical protein
MGGLPRMSSNFNTHIHTGSESNTFLCKYCSQVWLRRSSESKLPVAVDTNERHDCKLSPWNISKRGRARAVAVKKTELKKIEDHFLLGEIRDTVRHWNSRLGNYRLELHVIKKHPEEA